MWRCGICGGEVDLGSRDAVFGLNPETFFSAWMHRGCFREAFEGLASERALDLAFENRQDEFLSKGGFAFRGERVQEVAEG